MIVSREDAEGLFSKWATESNIVAFVTVVGGVSVTLNGSIKLAPSSLVIEYTGSEGWGVNRITIGLDSITEFNYQDIREAPSDIKESLAEGIASVLRLESPLIRCCIYERAS